MTRAILTGAFAAATLDILYAFVVYGPLSFGLTPMQVLQSVAAGWIGRDAARAGGWDTALLGAATHILIATLMATAFVLAASRFKTLTENAVLAGLVYGLILYVAMNYIVVPLSAADASHHFPASLDEAVDRLSIAFGGFRPKEPLMLAGTILTHTAFVGLPIALCARYFLR